MPTFDCNLGLNYFCNNVSLIGTESEENGDLRQSFKVILKNSIVFQIHQLVGAIVMIISIMMAIIGGIWTMNDSICNCPITPGPVHLIVIPIIDSVLLYLGISVSISGMIFFIVNYFRKKPLINS